MECVELDRCHPINGSFQKRERHEVSSDINKQSSPAIVWPVMKKNWRWNGTGAIKELRQGAQGMLESGGSRHADHNRIIVNLKAILLLMGDPLKGLFSLMEERGSGRRRRGGGGSQ
jgi:hypothetical protein